VARKDFLNLRGDDPWLFDALRRDRVVKTADDAAVLLSHLGLTRVDVLEVPAQALERRHRRGEDAVEQLAPRRPMRLERRDDEVVLAREEVVEAPLLHVGALANRIDADV